MPLADEVADLARGLGASVIGFAPVERFEGAPRGHHPIELLPGARSVISFGIRLLDRVLEWPDLLQDSELFQEPIRRKALQLAFYRRSGYDIVNDQLNAIALRVANYLEEREARALFFPATYGALPDELAFIPGMFSQRHAAVRAGLGQFGFNNVVLTPKYGPRIRFNSVITTAPLPPTPLLTETLCPGERCMVCVEACPGDAISILPDVPAGPLLDPPVRTQWHLCRKTRSEQPCEGLCLRVCPVGR